MPEWTCLNCSGIVLLGAVVGFLSGLFGVGGGFIVTPMLNIVFGIPMNIAIGSSLSQMIGTGTTATVRHWKEAAVDLKLAAILLGGAIGGVEIGTMGLGWLQGLGNVTVMGHEMDWSWMWLVTMSSFVLMLLIIGGGTLIESLAARQVVQDGGKLQRRVGRGFFNTYLFPPFTTLEGTEGRLVPLLVVIVIGFGIGLMKGFLGLGGGVVFVPILIYWLGCSTRMAVGTSLFVVVLSSIAGTITHGFRGNINLSLVMLMLVSSTFGAAFGAALHHRLQAHRVRLYFSFVLLAVLAVILLKMLWVFGIFTTGIPSQEE